MKTETLSFPRFVDRSTDKFFSHKDWREQLQILIRGYSYNDATDWYRQGMVKERAYVAFCRVWEWSNFRFSVDAQERFWQTYGKTAFLAKLNKTRAAFGFSALSC